MITNMSAAFHLLCFTPLVQREAALESVRSVHAKGDRIDGILILGSGADPLRQMTPAETDDFLDTVMLECLETGADRLPPVVTVPGQHDVSPLGPGQGMLAKALTRYWNDTERGLWRGDEDDIVEAIRDASLGDFVAWTEAHANFPEWRPGVLPGEGSVRLTTGTGTLGIVVANTVFRMAVPDATTDLATCTTAQLDSAVGESCLQWVDANDLTLVAAGHSAGVPAALTPALPRTLLLSSDGESARAGAAARWLVSPRGATRQHRLLRIDIVDARAPKIRDLAAPPAEQPIPLPNPRRSGGRAPLPRQATSEAYDAAATLENFYQQIGTGRMILVAVSGVHGEHGLTDVDSLTRQLTEAVYGEVPDPAPTTPEIWGTALSELGGRTVDQYIAELRGSDQESMTAARRVLQAPWWRIYDFTATDIFASVLEFDPRAAETNVFVNALQRKPEAGKATVEVVAMHGSPATPEGLDFGVPADDDLSPRALWFRRLKAELLTHPAVFIASSPSSRSLWNALALAQPQTEAERFPRFLITGPGTAADRARIRQAGLTHIQALPHEFAVQRLRPGLEILQQGKRRLADVRVGARRGSGIKLVSSLVDNAPTGSVEFLKGQDPTWGDVKDGLAVKLSIIDRIRASALPAEDGRHRIVLVEGRAGSGKTTALMQYAYELHQTGRTVAWIDREATDPLPNLKAQARGMSADAIFVDDVDIFGSLGASLLRELSNGGRALVVAAIRTTRSDELDVTFQSRRVSADEPLKDEDLGHIVDVLHTHGLPGYSSGTGSGRRRSTNCGNCVTGACSWR
ncbi:P-loop NTPase [Streptomyces sp. YKOK-I1]